MFAVHLLTAATDVQQSSSMNPSTGFLQGLVGYIITVMALWPVFTKAGRPGWAAVVPVYNTYTLVKIAGRHGALTVLFFIPIVNIIVAILVGVGRAFGRSTVFSVFLLWLFSVIGYFVIGYGKSTYLGAGGRR